VHDAGAVQDDFDPNNILLVAGPEQEPRLMLVDYERVELREEVPWSARVWNLAKCARFAGGGTAAERLRFLKAYAARDAGPFGWWKPLALAVLEELHAVRLRDARKAAEACVAEGRNYARVRCGEMSGWMRKARGGARRPGTTPADLEALYEAHRAFFEGSGRARLAGVAAGTAGGQIDLLRLPSGAASAWRGANMAARAALPCAWPLAVLQPPRGDGGVLVFESPAGAVPLPEFASDRLAGRPPGGCDPLKDRLLREVARVLGAFEAGPLGCAAIGPADFLVAPGPELRVVLQPPAGLQPRLRRGWGPAREHLHGFEDLAARLPCVTRTDRMRFLRRVFRAMGLPAAAAAAEWARPGT
jgi:hypothetical protein